MEKSMTFDELSILPALTQTLKKRGITPLPVQELTIPALLQGRPGWIVSRTGSGKTLAYLLPVLSDRKSTRLNPVTSQSRMPSSA